MIIGTLDLYSYKTTFNGNVSYKETTMLAGALLLATARIVFEGIIKQCN